MNIHKIDVRYRSQRLEKTT